MRSPAALNRSAAFASLSVAVVLVVLKSWAAWSTHSTAMLGSLADTTLDLAASLATLVGVWVAAMPRDEDHRFGHDKAEAVSAMIQVVLISVSALGLAIHSIEQFLAETRTRAAGEGIGVSLAALVLTLALLAWQRHVIRATGSVAIATDHVHYKSDLALNLAVVAALALDQYAGLSGADALFGLAIAGWLGWGAWRASREAVEQLMDKEWPDEKKARFLEVLSHQPDLRGVHAMRTRSAGNRDFVQFHAAVDGRISLHDAHRIMDDIEARLEAEFPGLEVIIHPDPEDIVSPAAHETDEPLR